LAPLLARSAESSPISGSTTTFMRQAARTLQSGNAALFLLIRKMTTDKVLAALRGAGEGR
jgi:uncharacterized membrane protein